MWRNAVLLGPFAWPPPCATITSTLQEEDMRISAALSAVFALSLWAAFAAAPPVLAQHETAADLLDGERAYRQSCANCHGPDGDVITGIDLGRGQFRRQMTDEDLVRIIRTGIPNTPMPPSTMTVEQAQRSE